MPAYFLEIIVVALGLLILMVDAFVKLEDKRTLSWIGMLGLLVVFGLLFRVEAPESTDSPFWQFYAADDRLALFFKGIAVLCTLVVLIMAYDFSPVVVDQTADPEPGAHPQAGLGEFFALPLFACAGLMWMASATNLVSIFVSLETVTIAFYIMVAYLRRNVGSLEAGVKYLILGALSTGFLVYGFAWLYGVTGSMQLSEISAALASPDVNRIGALFAFGLILVALAFKVGGAPFHFWIPDVYQGAPTPITAFLSVGSKAAGFIVLLRLVAPFLASEALSDKVVVALALIAVLTLLIGNFAAIPQKNFKRLLAYSSVAHAGFLLTALACSPTESSGNALTPVTVIAFYLGAYLIMTLLAFLVMTTVRKSIADETFDAYRGLAKRSPFLAAATLISMASLAGIPLTAGFWGKLFVFKLAVDQGQWVLLVVAILGACAGFYYYLKIAASMYLSEPDAKTQTIDNSPIPIGKIARFAMIAMIVAVIAVGIKPDLITGLFV
ncbi:MAG: NADH-quinone oxidoreductase subunit N [Verrucomicrobiales bacterium]|nr:NADH-quinone oxidoreductase subunit N [Verrucomicrobiales bacterium]